MVGIWRRFGDENGEEEEAGGGSEGSVVVMNVAGQSVLVVLVCLLEDWGLRGEKQELLVLIHQLLLLVNSPAKLKAQ